MSFCCGGRRVTGVKAFRTMAGTLISDQFHFSCPKWKSIQDSDHHQVRMKSGFHKYGNHAVVQRNKGPCINGYSKGWNLKKMYPLISFKKRVELEKQQQFKWVLEWFWKPTSKKVLEKKTSHLTLGKSGLTILNLRKPSFAPCAELICDRPKRYTSNTWTSFSWII